MKFIADRMLGKLAKDLRFLGYDTLYFEGDNLLELIDLGRAERRIILTRNTRLIPKRPEDRIIHISEDSPPLQMTQLIRQGYVQLEEGKLFSRCLLCNAILEEMSRPEVEGKVPDFIFHQHREFFRCPQCLRIYWPGTHEKNMRQKVKEIMRSQAEVEGSG